MGYIPKKTLEDLEFHQVLEQISLFAATSMGKDRCLEIHPVFKREIIEEELRQVSEFCSSFDNHNSIPNHTFQDVESCFPLLRIENSVLEVEAFKKIMANAGTVNALLTFFKKFKQYYPTLNTLGKDIEINKEIERSISRVIDRFGEIRDNASEKLFEIREEIRQLREKISSSFNKALRHYHKLDYLDDIQESVVENRRVLAVKAMYRRKVKGAIMGSSKTGSIVFVEPEVAGIHSRVLQNSLFEECEEIREILRSLTDQIRPFLPVIEGHQSYLLTLDVIFAKAQYAKEINGVFPHLNATSEINYIKAYHPLLLRTHALKGKPTYPQDIKLNYDNRIIVISGPNAGGKSITLKTVGLLQLMLQSGILIPVYERSSTCLFERILTDIGDNQSIENQLSTYSYRLKNMKSFLSKCNSRTLFLIDEFGTGSDPELGGALAEAILEVFYERESYGLITTHYSNLKLLANELPAMINANMQFDDRTLEPVFKLVMGEAGSSFTFEVARKNGLPYSLINRAKKKIERGKVRFDATIAKLQKERNQMIKTGQSLKEKESIAEKESEQLTQLNARLKNKLISYQELYDYNQKMIILGDQVNKIAERYFSGKKKRSLISELLHLVETENSKRKRVTTDIAKKEKESQERTVKEISKEIAIIRKGKEKKKKFIDKPARKSTIELVVGDRVRLLDGKAVGSIDTIEKNKATVNYGIFTTKVALEKLELVSK